MRANSEVMPTIGYAGFVVFGAWLVIAMRHVRKLEMNPILARVVIFLAIVIAAMLIIIGVASVSHAAECLPSARAVWAAHPGSHATWNAVDNVKCWRVGHPRKEVMPLADNFSRRRTHDTRPRSAHSPAGAAVKVRWSQPWHAELYEQFLDWKYLGRR